MKINSQNEKNGRIMTHGGDDIRREAETRRGDLTRAGTRATWSVNELSLASLP